MGEQSKVAVFSCIFGGKDISISSPAAAPVSASEQEDISPQDIPSFRPTQIPCALSAVALSLRPSKALIIQTAKKPFLLQPLLHILPPLTSLQRSSQHTPWPTNRQPNNPRPTSSCAEPARSAIQISGAPPSG